MKLLYASFMQTSWEVQAAEGHLVSARTAVARQHVKKLPAEPLESHQRLASIDQAIGNLLE